jgi:epoxyqueuosine reductase
MTKAVFERDVRPSSIGWIGRSRLRRNAAVAAGNLAAVGAIPQLGRMLREAGPMLRSHSAWALGRIGTADAIALLRASLDSEQEPDVIDEISAALPN